VQYISGWHQQLWRRSVASINIYESHQCQYVAGENTASINVKAEKSLINYWLIIMAYGENGWRKLAAGNIQLKMTAG
jgi:hypothetical protein